MKVLVVGSGGREHALVWKLAQSKKVERIFCAPGNDGIKEHAELVNIKLDDIEALLNFAKENLVDLTCVGPEAPLVRGIVDLFEEEGLCIFGPNKEAALLEGSKVFSKEIMKKFGVPSAGFKVFRDPSEAKKYLKKRGGPIVVKADGLAAGKGVVVAKTIEEAEEAIDSMLVKKIFGKAGERIILEDCLEGEEASILVFTDGENILPLVSSQDHKRIFDGDKGANTGGMGAYSPAPVVTDDLFDEIIKNVFTPIISGLKRDGKTYKGVLYGGIIITKDGPKVLEFNVRFGDPETQAILPRLKSDLVDVMKACIEGTLNNIELLWDRRHCISVVCASGGYPGSYEKGKEIFGLRDVKKLEDVIVFHAGTKYQDGKMLTDGGRVLGVTGLGDTLKSARECTYKAVQKIKFDGMHYRKDIGDKAFQSRVAI